MKLTVDGKTYVQPIDVKQDPRVKTPALVMQRLYLLTKAAYVGAVDAQKAVQEAQALREQIARAKAQATGTSAAALDAFDKRVEAAAGGASAGPAGGRGGGGGGFGASAGGASDTLNGASQALSGVMNSLQGADEQPTALQATTIETALRNARAAMARWNALKSTELAALNAQLKPAGITIK